MKNSMCSAETRERAVRIARELQAEHSSEWPRTQSMSGKPGCTSESLCDLGGDVDFALIDGWPRAEGPSLALQVMQVIAPQMQGGAIALNDNAEADYLDWVRNPANGFRSMTLPLKGGTELSVKG